VTDERATLFGEDVTVSVPRKTSVPALVKLETPRFDPASSRVLPELIEAIVVVMESCRVQ